MSNIKINELLSKPIFPGIDQLTLDSEHERFKAVLNKYSDNPDSNINTLTPDKSASNISDTSKLPIKKPIAKTKKLPAGTYYFEKILDKRFNKDSKTAEYLVLWSTGEKTWEIGQNLPIYWKKVYDKKFATSYEGDDSN